MDTNKKYGVISQKVIQTINAYSMDKLLSEASYVFVGLSGGADSTLLLLFLSDYILEKKFDCKLKALHLNHLIRGIDADNDEAFCKNLCQEIGVEFISKRVDVPKSANDSGEGIEEAARRERYLFFEEETSKVSGKVLVATAHNADDNLETVLLNMFRGSGALGLTGIPPVRDNKYIRPLIELSSMEIRSYLDDNKISYCVDKTNKDINYRRNYLRSEIIPRIRTIYPHPEVMTSRMSALIRSDEDYLRIVSSEISEKYKTFIPLDVIKNNHEAIISRVIRQIYLNVVLDDSSIEAVHFNAIMNLVKNGKNGSKLDLPGNVVVIIINENLVFDISKEDVKPFEYKLHMGENVFENEKFTIVLSYEKYNCSSNINKNFIQKTFDFDKINEDMIVRNRRDGDEYRYGGMKRKLKKLFQDKKIPQRERDALPIICDKNGILWVPGFGQREGTRYISGDKKLFVTYIKNQ